MRITQNIAFVLWFQNFGMQLLASFIAQVVYSWLIIPGKWAVQVTKNDKKKWRKKDIQGFSYNQTVLVVKFANKPEALLQLKLRL